MPLILSPLGGNPVIEDDLDSDSVSHDSSVSDSPSEDEDLSGSSFDKSGIVKRANTGSDSMATVQKQAGLHPFPATRGHLSTRRELIRASIEYVDHQGETGSGLWHRHACLQLHNEEERLRYTDTILDDCTPLATLLLKAVVSSRFNTVFNRSTFNALSQAATAPPADEGIYFVGAFMSNGTSLFGYIGRSRNIANRLSQHQKIITSPVEDPNHQQLFYRVARFAHQEGLQIFYQPLITILDQNPTFTTAILETIFATALGTYQKDAYWLQKRAEYDLPAVPYLGVNSTPCLEFDGHSVL